MSYRPDTSRPKPCPHMKADQTCDACKGSRYCISPREYEMMPVAAPDTPVAPNYPEGDVLANCICGGWPGGKCLKCSVAAPLPAAPAPTEQAPGDMPTLPQHLLDVIGEYGCARSDDVGEMEILHRWETLIAGIKNYAWAVLAARQAPTEQEIIGGFAIKVEKLLCAALRREWSASGISIESLIGELATRQAPDSRDAERYQWLRRAAEENLQNPDASLPWVVRVELDPWPTTKAISGGNLDASIDAAIAQEKAQ